MPLTDRLNITLQTLDRVAADYRKCADSSEMKWPGNELAATDRARAFAYEQAAKWIREDLAKEEAEPVGRVS